MDGDTCQSLVISESDSLDSILNQYKANVTDIKLKLHEILTAGKDYDQNVVSSLSYILHCADKEILTLGLQAVAELTKCERKRLGFAQKDIIEPILNLIQKDFTKDRITLFIHCCRAVGNLCCDCDEARNLIIEYNGVTYMIGLFERILNQSNGLIWKKPDLRVILCKCLLNFSLGGAEMSGVAVEAGVIDCLSRVLQVELSNKDPNHDLISSALLLLSVINDNDPAIQFNDGVNCSIVKILKATTDFEISENCLENLLAQVEHDKVKTILANEGTVQVLCEKLDMLIAQQETGVVSKDDADVKALMKQACELIVVILNGDEAMDYLFEDGMGEVYLTMISWLQSKNNELLITAILAISNFARKDTNCQFMMKEKVYYQILEIFEAFHAIGVSTRNEPEKSHSVDELTVTKVEHASLAALRNLTVPACNKRDVASDGRAVPVLLNALPTVGDPQVAYKLLAALRMLVDGQEGVCAQLCGETAALAATARWALAGEHVGAAGEAPRLLAWAAKLLPHHPAHRTLYANLVQTKGCLACLVHMLISSHSVMQSEGILAITILAIESFKKGDPDDIDHGAQYTDQLIEAEIGKHVSVLIESNCAKMPIEVANNLIAFLSVTSKQERLCREYKKTNVDKALLKFADSRSDLGDLGKAVRETCDAISSIEV